VACRVLLGLPEDWNRVEDWLRIKNNFVINDQSVKMPNLKNPEVLILDDYNTPAEEKFWVNFPSNPIPKKPVTIVDVDLLESFVSEKKHLLLNSAWSRAHKAIKYLRHGGPSFQNFALPSCTVKNSRAAIVNGKYITDNLASWIKKDFVSGPFSSPPLKNFRSNSILAVPQPGKVRICMNVSLPKGKSFNDNIQKHSLEKVKMTSAKKFGFSILESGQGAIMSKFDFVDAYKLIPARQKDIHLQGFSWLGKFFTENRMTFGGEPSVQNFDIVGATIKELTLTDCSIPSKLVHRQLDDVPVVAPKNSGWCEEFSSKYKNLCNEINMKLAPDCSLKDKAFTCSTYGKVLGIEFNSENLTWTLPLGKRELALKAVKNAIESVSMNLKNMQKLMGRLNHVSQMCTFLNGFRDPLNRDLAKLIYKSPKSIQLSVQSKKDLTIWGNFLSDDLPLPIPHPRTDPPLCTKNFVTDAAGFSKSSKWFDDIGIGAIGVNEKNDTFFTSQFFWPKDFITQSTDKHGKNFGNKSTSLETIGVLLPFLLIPEKLMNQHIVCGVDNTGVIFGWQNKKLKRDGTASILIRALHLIEAYLGSVIHVVHVPRLSNWEATVADSLSRKKTTHFLEKQMLKRTGTFGNLKPLTDWLKNPVEDWNLPITLLSHVQSRCENK